MSADQSGQKQAPGTIGIGVVGTGGRISHLIRTLPGLGDRIRVTAIHDQKHEFVERAQSDYAADARVYDDYQDLVRDPTVDWVFIGSWNALHAEHAIAAFEAGKHVFCEKPIATTLEDAVAMRNAQQIAGTNFLVGFTLRFSPHYRKIHEIVTSGEIGSIVSFEFNETLDFNHGGYIHSDWRRLGEFAGSHLLEKCCHDLDIANWMTGSLARRVASFGGLSFFTPENRSHQDRLGPDPETNRPAFQTWWTGRNPFTVDKDIVDNQIAIIEYANGVRATFHTNCVSGIPERRMYIVGTEGAIRADVLPGTIEVKRYGWNTTIDRRDTGASEGHGGGDEVLVTRLAAAMVNGDEPEATLHDGLTSAITAFAIDDAMKQGTVIDVAPYWEYAGIELDAAPVKTSGEPRHEEPAAR